MGTIKTPLFLGLLRVTVLLTAATDIVAEPQVHEAGVYALPNRTQGTNVVKSSSAALHGVVSSHHNTSASTITGRFYLRAASNHSEVPPLNDTSIKDTSGFGKDQEPVAELDDDTRKNPTGGNIGNGTLLTNVTGLSDHEDAAEAEESIPPFSTLDADLLSISDGEALEGMEDVELMSGLASSIQNPTEPDSGESTHNNVIIEQADNEEQNDDAPPVEETDEEYDQGHRDAPGDTDVDLPGMRDVELMSEIASGIIRSGTSADSSPKGTINDDNTLTLDVMGAQQEEEGGGAAADPENNEADGSKHVAMIPAGDTRASLGIFRFDGTTAYITPPPPNMDPFFMPGGLITVQELNYETSGIDGEAWGDALRTGTFTIALLGISYHSGRSQEMVSTVPSGTFCCPEGLELNTRTAEIKVGGASLKANADVDSSFESLVLTSDAISGDVTIYGKSHGGAAKELSHYNSPGGMAFSRLYYLNIGGVGYGGAWYLGFAGTIKSIEFFDNHVDKDLAWAMLEAYSSS